MATRSQIGRLAQRIDAIATRMAPPPPPMAMEWWIVEREWLGTSGIIFAAACRLQGFSATC